MRPFGLGLTVDERPRQGRRKGTPSSYPLLTNRVKPRLRSVSISRGCGWPLVTMTLQREAIPMRRTAAHTPTPSSRGRCRSTTSRSGTECLSMSRATHPSEAICTTASGTACVTSEERMAAVSGLSSATSTLSRRSRDACRSCQARSLMLWGRAFGSFARSCRTRAASLRGVSGRRARRSGTGASMCICSTSQAFS